MKPYANSQNIEEKCREWLERVRPFNRSELRVKSSNSALIVIDMQNFFIDEASPTFTSGGKAIMPNVRRLIEAFRDAERPVIYTRHVHHPDDLDIGIMGWWWQGKCVDGTPESEICEELAPLPREKVISKHRYSAFYNTDLETVLRCMRIEDIVIAGVMTNLCCESTARDAYFRDYRVFFPADATGATREEFHISSLINLAYGFASITTTKRIIGELRGLSTADNTERQ